MEYVERQVLYAKLGTSAYPSQDAEKHLMEHIVREVTREEITNDPFQVVNFYIALKSKPLLLLAGPGGTGKCELVNQIGYELTRGEATRFQMMNGHAWWAARSENLSELTRLQDRFIAEKAREIIFEACSPENLDRLYILFVQHISPAELLGYFSDLALQLRHGEIRRLLSVQFPHSLPFPPNLRLIGTIDIPLYSWFEDSDLLAQTTIIHWPQDKVIAPVPLHSRIARLFDNPSLDIGYIGSANQAKRKLNQLPAWREEVQPVLINLLGWLVKHGVPLPTRVIMDEAFIYLANAFSNQGSGLFAADAGQNLWIALDFVLAQIVLPRAWGEMTRSAMLRGALKDQLDTNFSQTLRLIENIPQST